MAVHMFEGKENLIFTICQQIIQWPDIEDITQSGYILCPTYSMRDICIRIKARQIFHNELELSLSGKQ